MELKITKEWLLKKLEQADDSSAGAGGTELAELRKDAQRRTVTPEIFSAHSSQLGRVVRFVREKRGWSRSHLAELALIEEHELAAIETDPGSIPSPRAVIFLADALGLSRQRLKELVGFVKDRDEVAANDDANDGSRVKFAANSKNICSITDDEYDAVRALVEILSEDERRR